MKGMQRQRKMFPNLVVESLSWLLPPLICGLQAPCYNQQNIVTSTTVFDLEPAHDPMKVNGNVASEFCRNRKDGVCCICLEIVNIKAHFSEGL